MSDKRDVSEIVTKFLLNTCRLRPQLSRPALEAALYCAQIETVRRQADNVCTALTTGSVAEFYIEPMLPHVGDVDVMYHLNTQLAIPRGQSPPSQLPAEFNNCVNVFEMADSNHGGYVYLQLRYLLTECPDEGEYKFVEYSRHRHLFNGNRWFSHGPATFHPSTTTTLGIDTVRCVRCLMWPSQAADWPIRHRNYGWPDSATVDRVVSIGCDVVGVAHRQCRQDEWMRKHQWRLSFSRAEIVLINSWMPVQQIVYHMLRFFMKTQELTDSGNHYEACTLLSNYHIKVLMLWASELKPNSRWTDDFNLVRMCVQLLHYLADWLADARCQHYFINNCNLIDNSFNLANIRDQLLSVDEMWLSKWFVENYIQNCFQLCPRSTSQLLNDVSTSMKLQNAVSAVVAWRLESSLLDSYEILNSAEYQIPFVVYTLSLNTRSVACWLTELSKIDARLCVYFRAVAMLYDAYRSLRRGLNDEQLQGLATLFGNFATAGRYSNNFTSSLSLEKATMLMTVAVNKSLSTVQRIEIELSKAYLYRTLKCKDSDSDSIYCLANVYLALLYYTTRQYQTALDHCTLVIQAEHLSRCSSRVVHGEILPKIDGDIDNVLGLAVFYQHVRSTALSLQKQTQQCSVFTTQLFAYYLHTKYLLVTTCDRFMQTSSPDSLKRYELCITDTKQLFISDVLLFVALSGSLKQKCKEPIIIPTEHNAPDLTELLQMSAVEHLTTYRQMEARDFGSVVTIATTDFEAVYAYKRGDYQQCLQLSTQNVHTLLYAVHMPNIRIFPEFIQLLDDDIVSLTALTLLVNPECRNHSFYVTVNQLNLSLYLMTQSQLKIRHTVTSIAQTLDYIEIAQRRRKVDQILNQLTLKLIERKVVAYISSRTFFV